MSASPLISKRYRCFFFGICTLLTSFYIFSNAAWADSLTITATVPAPLPTAPAIITYPVDQQHLTTSSTQVEGTCSNDTAYVELYRNNVLAGTTPCINGGFTLLMTLLPGANALQAQALSSTGGKGPVVPPITVYYDIINPPPSISPTPGTSPIRKDIVSAFLHLIHSQLSQQKSIPFFITAKQTYDSHKPGEQLLWLITVHGGVSPYTLIVRWGDGQTTTETIHETTINFKHIYNNSGFYRIDIRAIDSVGNEATLQLVAVINGDAVQASRDMVVSPKQSNDWLTLIAAITLGLALLLFITQLQKMQFLFPPFFFKDKLKKRHRDDTH